MKIQIVKEGDPSIGGYEVVNIRPNSLDLSKYSDNECEFIHAAEIFDCFNLENHPQVVAHLLTKLRMGGTIVLGGTDIKSFCKSVINAVISETDASACLGRKVSMSNAQTIKSLLESLNLKVQFCQINGMHYEFTAVR